MGESYGALKVYEVAYKRYKSQKNCTTRYMNEYFQCEQKVNNQTLGICLEKNLCLFNNLNYPLSFNFRGFYFYQSALEPVLEHFFKSNPHIRLKKYIGSYQNMADFV